MLENSFKLVSDPRALYLTNALKDTTDKVHFTIQKRLGLTCVLGDIGLGKTSVLRLLHWQYEDDKENYITTIIPTPKFSSDFAMLKQICADFDVQMKRSFYEQQKAFEVWLAKKYQENKNVVVFIDEAQKLKNQELELIRVMLNLETYDHKLIQIILAGQLELREKLLDPKNKALYSRVFTPSVLSALTLEETKKMIAFRCHVFEMENPFNDESVELLYQYTKGIPRDIVKLVLEAYRLSVKDSVRITPQLIQSASKHLTENKYEETGDRTHKVRRHSKAEAKPKARKAKSTK